MTARAPLAEHFLPVRPAHRRRKQKKYRQTCCLQDHSPRIADDGPVFHAREYTPGAEQLSGEQLFHDLAFDIGQSKLAALEAIRQPRVIEAQPVEQSGVEIVN